MSVAKRRGLGRGLDALLQSTAAAEPASAGGGLLSVAVDSIRPNPYQPRLSFDEEALEELAASIRAQGLIQPLLVRPSADGYVLIAGERRWQAARRAGLTEVPVVLRQASDREMLALAIIENVQRENLDPIESALSYRRLMQEFDLTQAEVAGMVGKSRVAVANAVRLLGLPESLRGLVSAGQLSEGHARALLPIKAEGQLLATARRALEHGWTVRRTEAEVRRLESAQGDHAADGKAPAAAALDPDSLAAVEAMQSALGTRVELRRRSDGGGHLVLHFFSEEELSALYRRLVDGDPR